MTNINRGGANSTFIAQGDIIDGSLKISGILVVDGVINGDISCGCLIVGETGVVNGVVTTNEAEVYGRAGHKMNVEKSLTVYGSGIVEGLWNFDQIVIEKGGSVNGNHVSSRITISNWAQLSGDSA